MIKLKRDKINLSASVSCCDLYNFEKDYKEIEKSKVSFLHYDVVDGFFNNCIILGTTLLEAIRPHVKLPIEVHLAVNKPDKFIEQFAKAGADYIAVHYEVMDNPFKIFKLIEKNGAIPILALKSNIAFNQNILEISKDVPWILKLTVNPGYSGQKIQQEAIKQIKEMRLMLNEAGLTTGIQADGNINEKTIPEVIAAGADILTGGTSGLFKRDNTIKYNAEKMIKIAEKTLLKYIK